MEPAVAGGFFSFRRRLTRALPLVTIAALTLVRLRLTGSVLVGPLT